MGVYCLITSTDGQKNYIVQTKNIYQLNEEKQLVPIILDKFKEGKCFVRDENIRVGNTAFYVIDSHDNPKVLKNRNKVSTRIIVSQLPKYSPKLTSKASKRVKRTSAVNNTLAASRTESELGSAEFYSRTLSSRSSSELHVIEDEATIESLNEIDKENTPNPRQQQLHTPLVRRNVLRRRPYNQQHSATRIDRFRQTKKVQEKKNTKIQQLLQQQNSERVTNLTERIVRENGVEYRQVGNIRMDSEEYSSVSLKKSMRLRAGFITKKLWSSEERLNMYVKLPPGAVNCVRVSRQHCQQVIDICLYLQRVKEIKYLPGSEDDIDINIRVWIGQFLNEHRSQLRKMERNLARQ